MTNALTTASAPTTTAKHLTVLEDEMRHCDGRLFDGSACNNNVFECAECGASGCYGDGCDNQSFVTTNCCGADLGAKVLATAAA